MDKTTKDLLVCCMNIVAEANREKDAYQDIDSFKNGYVSFAREILDMYGIDKAKSTC